MIKTRIHQTATTMFNRNGFKAVSVDDICHAVGIAKKTFYLSYSNKDELVREFVDGVFSGLQNSLRKNLIPEGAASRLKIFDDHVTDFLMIFYPVLISDLKRYHNDSYRIFEGKREELIACLAAILELGKRQGAFRKKLDSRILAELRFSELETIFSKRMELKINEWDHSNQELFDHFLAGVAVKELNASSHPHHQ